jgi:hypothetical protein
MFDWMKLPALKGLFGGGGKGEEAGDAKPRVPPPPRAGGVEAAGGGAPHDMADVFSGVVDGAGRGVHVIVDLVQQAAGDQDDTTTPPPAAEPVDPVKAVNAVTRMLNADKVGTNDREAILKALRGSTPEQLDAMRVVFKTLVGEDADMDAWVRNQMTVDDTGPKGPSDAAKYNLAEAEAALSGDVVKGTVAALENAAYGGEQADPAKILNLLWTIYDEDERTRVAAEWEAKHGKPLGDLVREQLRGTDEEMGLAILDDADDATVASIEMAAALEDDDEKRLGMAIDDQLGYEPETVVLAYAQRIDPTIQDAERAREVFEEEMRKRLSGAELDMVLARAAGDDAGADAARMEQARVTGDVEEMNRIVSGDAGFMEDLPPEERAETRRAHQERMDRLAGAWSDRYGEKDAQGQPTDTPLSQFQDAMKGAVNTGDEHLDSMEHTRLISTMHDGAMSRVEMLRYAETIPGHEDMFRSATSGLDDEARRKLLQEWRDERTYDADSVPQGRAAQVATRELEFGTNDLDKLGYAADVVAEELPGASEETALRSNKDDLLARSNDEMRKLGSKVLEGTATEEERQAFEIHWKAMQSLLHGWHEDVDTMKAREPLSEDPR